MRNRMNTSQSHQASDEIEICMSIKDIAGRIECDECHCPDQLIRPIAKIIEYRASQGFSAQLRHTGTHGRKPGVAIEE